MRVLRGVFAAGAAAALAAAPALSATPRYAAVAGPLDIPIGGRVTLVASGFPANRSLTVDLWLSTQTLGAHPCCTARISNAARTDNKGRAIIRFRWPKTYVVEPGGHRVRWASYDIAIVIVTSADWSRLSNPDAARATKVVFLR